MSKENLEIWAYRFLCASAFGATFSLPFGRICLVLSFVLFLAHFFKTRHSFCFPATAWFALLFSVVAAIVTFFGINPDVGLGKLDKLAWFLAIPITASLVTTRSRVTGILKAFAFGTALLSLEIVIWRVIAAARLAATSTAADNQSCFISELKDLGSMTDGQMLMLGIIVAVGLIYSARSCKNRGGWLWGLLALQSVALLVNLKRGSWFCAFIVVGAFVAIRAGRKVVLILIALVVIIFALPPVWSRLSDLRLEFDTERGGRLTMWTKIAPPLIKDHPWGIGYRSLTSELMQSVAAKQNVHVEHNRNHLHSNPIQILVATGWLGLCIFIIWMTRSVYDGFRFMRNESGRAPPDRAPALVLLLMFVALLLNGLLEYNFSDGELVLVYGMIMGTMAKGSSL